MSISILNNTSASQVAADLSRTSLAHQESLAKLSSGSRIQKFSDDAGGIAVSIKMTSALHRNSACQANVSNAISYLQTQAGGLKMLGNVFTRMSELVVMMRDSTKSSSDLDNYVSEMAELAFEVDKLRNEQFNGIDLFNHGGNPHPLTVQLSEDGAQTLDMAFPDLGTTLMENIISSSNSRSTIDPQGNSGGLTAQAYQNALEAVSTAMAQNGALQSRLGFALDSLMVNHNSAEAANSRIYDLDVAAETTHLSRTSVMLESGAKMLNQANTASQTALKLIQQ